MYTFECPDPKVKSLSMLFILMFVLPAFIQAQTDTALSPDPMLTPWIGVWTIVDDQQAESTTDESIQSVVEISPTKDGKGLNISRQVPQKPDVKESLIPDGVRRPIRSNNCTGWQTAKWFPEAGLIIGSSEITCKESESYDISNLRMIVSADRMVDVLAVKASGQTRVAVRHLVFSSDFPSAGDSPNQIAMAARISASAPWDLDKIIQLSKIIDVPSFQAALLEKDTRITLNPKALKRMTAANVPKPVIDLLVAQAFPEKFVIEKNGQVAVSPSFKSGSYGGDSSTMPSAIIYPSYRYGGYYSPFGYPADFYWSYYSPFWYGYPIYFYNWGGSANSGGSSGPGGQPGRATGGQLSISRGYVQITPNDTERHAVPIQGYVPSSGRSTGYAQTVPSGAPSGVSSGGSYSAPAASSGGGYSSGGTSGSSSGGGASASPAGYSSGSSSGGGQAVPRQ